MKFEQSVLSEHENTLMLVMVTVAHLFSSNALVNRLTSETAHQPAVP